MMVAMTFEEIGKRLQNHSGWRCENNWLARDLQFANFEDAWQFMSYIAACAEEQDHHPNWYNVYGTVQIRLSSHDANGVTQRDFALAAKIDEYLTEAAFNELPPTPIFNP
ncbi:MAG: 4a-hydroxytetrahydrobiopterin dehydratase [Luminiphilus sp.]